MTINEVNSPPWKILLLGGGAAVGKSTAAARIARRYLMSLVPTDLVWLALQAVTDAETHPELHYFDPSLSDFTVSPERLFERHVKTANSVSDCLEPIVASLLRSDESAVVEGAWITPEFACRHRYQEVNAAGRVRSVFIHEPDLDKILETMARRSRLSTPTSLQQVFARVCWLHGNWLAGEAKRLGVPVVSARPQRNLLARVLVAGAK